MREGERGKERKEVGWNSMEEQDGGRGRTG